MGFIYLFIFVFYFFSTLLYVRNAHLITITSHLHKILNQLEGSNKEHVLAL